MQLILPLAGDDNRFKTYKPFIVVRDQPLISHVLAQHDISAYSSITFIIRSDHEKKYNVNGQLRRLFSFPFEIKIIKEKTQGAPCTILEAMGDRINTEEPILVELADVVRDLSSFYTAIQTVHATTHLIPVQSDTCFADRPWGYVETGADNKVEKLNEKMICTTPGFATMGLYHFAKGNDFVQAVHQMIRHQSFLYDNNFFIGPVYNELLKYNHEVRCCETKIKYLF